MTAGATPSNPTVTIVGVGNATYSISSFTTAPDVTYQYSYTSSGSESERWKNLAITGTDYVGNGATGGSASNAFIIDRTAPGIPGTPSASANGYTNNTSPTFSWTASTDTSGSGVASYFCQIGTTAGGSDVFSGSVGAATSKNFAGSNGNTYYCRVYAIDNATNQSAYSANGSIVVDTVVAVPAMTGVSDDAGASSSDMITNDTTLVFSGTAEANASVELEYAVASGGPYAPFTTVSANASGAWSFDYTAFPIASGTYYLHLRAIELATNTSVWSNEYTVVIDTTPPPDPVMTSLATDAGVSASDLITNDQTLIYYGTCAEPGATVDVSAYLEPNPPNGLVGLSIPVDGSGNWIFDNTAGVADEGAWHLQWAAKDTAGNVSGLSPDYLLVIDITLPVVNTVAVQTGLTVNVTFSEPMSGSGVTTASNYTVSGTGKGTLANNPNSVALVSGNTYRLTWTAGEMLNGGNITVTVTGGATGAKDIAGNATGTPNSGAHTGGAIGVAPTVTGRSPAPASTIVTNSGANIDVTFSEPVQGADVTDMALSGPAAAGASVGLPTNQGGDTWRFPLSGLTAGALNISVAPDPNDIEDLAGNDLAPIAWSYTIEAEVLSVTVTPDQWVIGAQALNFVGESAAFTAQNDGNIAEDFSVRASDGLNGWTLESAIGTDAFVFA